MLYDGYLLHLEKADREVMLKAYPELEWLCEDVTTRAAALVSSNKGWAHCFDLVLTEVSSSLVYLSQCSIFARHRADIKDLRRQSTNVARGRRKPSQARSRVS